MIEVDNLPIGILLCTDKGSEMVEYALSGMDNQLFVSTYMFHLPTKEQLVEFMRKTLRELSEDKAGLTNAIRPTLEITVRC